MSWRALPAFVLVVSLAPGCRGLHEAEVKQRLLQTRFFQSEVRLPLVEVDAKLESRRQEEKTTPVESAGRGLVLRSARTEPDGARFYCFTVEGDSGCLEAREASPGVTRFTARAGAPVPAPVVRAVWRLLDEGAAIAANNETEVDVPALAAEEEERFEGRWSFAVGARSGAVVSFEPPTFTFGGHAGVRYWANYFVVPGATIEAESMLQSNRNTFTLGVNGRTELTMWLDENARFLNLPNVSFAMSAGPIIGFGARPSVGARATVAVHIIHLARYLTPFFFELGFQSLRVDSQSASGLRVAVGAGF